MSDRNEKGAGMTDKRCKTCRWWKDGLCIQLAMIQRNHNDSSVAPQGIKADVVHTGTAGGIPTGPDFGCIHWEEAE